MLRFGKLGEAKQTMNAVTAYVSMSPHWGYCGAVLCARRILRLLCSKLCYAVLPR